MAGLNSGRDKRARFGLDGGIGWFIAGVIVVIALVLFFQRAGVSSLLSTNVFQMFADAPNVPAPVSELMDKVQGAAGACTTAEPATESGGELSNCNVYVGTNDFVLLKPAIPGVQSAEYATEIVYSDCKVCDVTSGTCGPAAEGSVCELNEIESTCKDNNTLTLDLGYRACDAQSACNVFGSVRKESVNCFTTSPDFPKVSESCILREGCKAGAVEDLRGTIYPRSIEGVGTLSAGNSYCYLKYKPEGVHCTDIDEGGVKYQGVCGMKGACRKLGDGVPL